MSKITGVVGGAIDAAKNLLGIHSPSRVFRKIFGYVMEGAALGIDDTADEPVKSMRSAVRNVEKAAVFGASVTGGGAYGATANGAAGFAGGGNVYNLYLDGDLLGVDRARGLRLQELRRGGGAEHGDGGRVGWRRETGFKAEAAIASTAGARTWTLLRSGVPIPR